MQADPLNWHSKYPQLKFSILYGINEMRIMRVVVERAENHEMVFFTLTFFFYSAFYYFFFIFEVQIVLQSGMVDEMEMRAYYDIIEDGIINSALTKGILY